MTSVVETKQIECQERETSRLSSANILVVDDDDAVRGFVTALLIREGYRVVAVESGEHALEAIATQTFDLALIDLKMPGIGGIDVLTVLRQQSPDTAAIILTGQGSLESAVEAVRQGAHDYLFKPCKTDTLRKSVRAGLEKRRHTQLQHAREKFVSDVSHQLRTPITTIDLNLYLAEKSTPEKRAYHLDRVKQGTTRMKRIVENTILLSRLESGEVRIEFMPENLNLLIEQILVAHQARVEEAGLELVFEPGADLPPVRIARKLLAEVVTNLVNNAINYTPSGQVRISTHLDAARERVCLQVQDTGIGIEAQTMPCLFKRFYRSPRAANSDVPGNGLGLAIAREIVELHRGEIQVESQVGVGSTFTVCLPL